MDMSYAITGKNINKKYKNFELKIDEVKIPRGFATALIGENGAGKTTFLDALAGIKLNFKGEFDYFGIGNNIDDADIRERIGYLGPNNYFLPNWKLGQVRDILGILFDRFDGAKYEAILNELGLQLDGIDKMGKKVSELSDGNVVKVKLAGVLARETDILLMDEPASPLDPLMRDKLSDLIRDYIEEGQGEKSVLFSTHNIADMESVTDYAIIIEQGRIVEEGFVEDLKEKYVYVKGEPKDADFAKTVLYSMNRSNYGFEGVCLSKDLDSLAGCDIVVETPSLSQISVAVMKKFTVLSV